MDWKYLISNPNGTPSVTKLAFITAFIIVNIKLMLSGISIGSFTIPTFTGTDYAMILGTLSATYIFRAKDGSNQPKE